jgi:hypothetical protein
LPAEQPSIMLIKRSSRIGSRDGLLYGQGKAVVGHRVALSNRGFLERHNLALFLIKSEAVLSSNQVRRCFRSTNASHILLPFHFARSCASGVDARDECRLAWALFT